MNQIVLKRQLAEAVSKIVKNREPNVGALVVTCANLGALLTEWTGEPVKVTPLGKTDLARIWREVNGSNRWPSDVDDFIEKLLK